MKDGAKYFRPDIRGNGRMVETDKNHCLTPFCRGLVHKGREHSPYCTHCRRIRWKNKNPLRYSFGNLRRRARQRGIDFTLTFEAYKSFAERTDYAKLKGKTSLSLSIDRINNEDGYHAWNIQAITIRENSRKQFVPYFAHQIENQTYKPTQKEIEEIQRQL